MGVTPLTNLWITLRFGVLFALSAMIVLLARLWRAFWPLICVALVYLGSSALGSFTHLSMTAQWLVIAVFILAAWWLQRLRAAPFVWPQRAQIEHAMERAADLPHRPLATLRDRNSMGDDAGLWAQHRQHARQARGKVKLARFDGDISRHDHFDLRHIAGLFFAVALVIGGTDVPARIAGALTPPLPALPAAQKPALDVWITPPVYTQIAPVYLARANNTEAQLSAHPAVPAGSTLKIRISGQRLPPLIRLDGARLAVTRLDGRNYTAEATLAHDSNLTIRQALRPLGQWDIGVVADQPPKINLTDAGKGGNGLLQLTWQAGDDYGITALSARITPADDSMAAVLDGADDTIVDLPLPVRPQPGKKQDGMFNETIDLSRHPLSGSAVNVTLTARDDAGQEVSSNTREVILPVRRFNNALAQRVADERSRLFLFAKSWIVRDLAIAELIDIVNRPALYRGDRSVFMGLISAIKRLGYDARSEGLYSTRELLWDVALRIEDGGLSEAARELQEALTDLTAALSDPAASPQELEELLGEVQQKMQDYMQAMANELQQRQQMQQQQSGAAEMPPEIANQVIKKIDMDALLENMRQMASGDNREALRQMMENLRKSVQNMDVDAVARMQKQQQQSMQALQGLADVIRAQQELIEATTQTTTGNGDASWQELSAAQGEINSELQGVQGKLGPLAGQMQGDLSAADDLMGLSRDRLSEQQGDNALAAQKNALKALMKAQDNAMQQLANQMQQMMMLGMGGQQQGGGFGEGFDPLGRDSGNGKNAGGTLGLPDEGERRRVQDIQDELRERYNDSERPRTERDYLERLLDLFN